MNRRVLGAKWLVLGAVLGAGCGVLVPGAQAQERIANAKLETASGSQGLSRAIQTVASRSTTTWIGYQVPIVADSGRRMCEARPPRAFLESPPTFTVLTRFENGRPTRLRTFTPECDIDAGGMPLVWLSDVKPDESVAWLATLVSIQPGNPPRRELLAAPAIAAIALHAAPAAVPQLISLAKGPNSTDIRKDAMTWLGRSKDPQALKFLEELLTR